KKMSLDTLFRLRICQRWPNSDVYSGGKGLTLCLRMRRIDPVGRQDQPGNIQVGSGRAELAAEFIAAYNAPGNRIGPTEHLRSRVEISFANAFADACAADGFSVQRHGGQP